MTEKSKKTAPPKIFDVSRPGNTAPSASSKPILITNRPVLQDPMVVDDTAMTTASLPGAPLVPSAKLKIKPIHIDSEPSAVADTAEADATTSTVDKPIVTTKIPLKPEQNSPEATTLSVVNSKSDQLDPVEGAKAATPAEQIIEPLKTKEVAAADSPDLAATPLPTTDSDPAVNKKEKPKLVIKSGAEPDVEDPGLTASEGTAGSKKEDDEQPEATSDTATTIKIKEEAARLQLERTAELDKLAESHKYYLPINQVEKRKNKRNALLGVLLIAVLAVAWADISLDAGIIHLSGIKPLTHFFSK